MIHIVDGKSELYLDDALSPIFVLTWIGPATLELAEQFRRWRVGQTAEAKRLGRPVVMVHDGTGADGPKAEVRRAFGEQRFDPEVASRSFVVVTNPLVRGAMTAIGWMMGDAFDVVACKTMADAFAQAAAYARSHGLVPPSDSELGAYVTRKAARSA